MHLTTPMLTATARRAHELASALRRHATAYLKAGNDPGLRADAFARLLADQARVRMLPEKYRARISRQNDLMALLGRAHAEHAATEGPTLVVPGMRREYEAARAGPLCNDDNEERRCS